MADNETLVARGPSLVRWGAVFGGAVAGLAVFVLLTTLWVAWSWKDLGGGRQAPAINNAFIQNNLEWFLAGSGVFATLVAGFIAGWFSGLRGAGVGGLNGFIAWSVVVTASVILGAPSLMGIQGLSGGTTVSFEDAWAPFWTLLAGFGSAILGGVIGGSAARPKALFEPQAVDLTEIVDEGDVRIVRTRQATVQAGTGNVG